MNLSMQVDDDLKEALRHAAALLAELRTGALGPQKYYELFMQASDELSRLEAFFNNEAAKGRSYADLYERVQHAGNVVPRLYLLCSVGACYIRSSLIPAKEILRDLMDMCKGVQHPTRGLFLRAYLVQVCRGLLPDTGSKYESPEGGDVVDAMDFLLTNFTEMNKLWVRMGHQGSARDKERREQERSQLADLVGKNLTGLSQLDGLTFELYKDIVLPRVLEQVVVCKDELAQQYLMQCTIAAFPDDFHLGTLDVLLGTLPQLQPGVKLAGIMSSLLDRLASYAAADPALVEQLTSTDAFGRMSRVASQAVEQHPDMPGAELAALYAAQLSFAGTVYPERLDYVDMVLGTCFKALSAKGTQINEPKTERQVVSLLAAPLEKYDIVTVLQLENYLQVMGLLPFGKQRDISRRIAETAIKTRGDQGWPISDAKQVEVLLAFLAPLLRENETSTTAALDEEDISDDAALTARLIHVLRNDTDFDAHYAICELLLKTFAAGGPLPLKQTIPPLCFSILRAVRTLADTTSTKKSEICDRWYKMLHKAATALAEVPCAEMALEMFLAGALSASEEAHAEVMAYEFFEQAFILYEEAIPDSKAESLALHSIIGTLNACRVTDEDSRAALVHKASGYCAKLLKKTDQCLAVLAVSHLYWQQQNDDDSNKASNTGEEQQEQEGATEEKGGSRKKKGGGGDGVKPGVQDGAGVLSCLKRALRIAAAQQQQLATSGRKTDASSPGHLYVEILNAYLYYFDAGVKEITPAVLQSVLELAGNEVGSEACVDDEALQTYYKNTLQHIKYKKAAGSGNYDELQL